MDAACYSGFVIATEPLRLFLQDELVRRIQANRRYSARAFARSLGIDSSLLSKILRGERAVSRKLFAQLSERLELNPADFLELPEPKEDTRFVQMNADRFHLIADWYHYAIYEMATLKGFRSDIDWVARALDISKSEASAALARLERLGMLGRNARGKLIRQQPKGMSTTGDPQSAPAFRKLQRQILEGAVRAMEEISIERRDQSSMTMAVDSQRLPEAKALIRQFRRKLCKLLENAERADEVYQLSVALYPVTHFSDFSGAKKTRRRDSQDA